MEFTLNWSYFDYNTTLSLSIHEPSSAQFVEPLSVNFSSAKRIILCTFGEFRLQHFSAQRDFDAVSRQPELSFFLLLLHQNGFHAFPAGGAFLSLMKRFSGRVAFPVNYFVEGGFSPRCRNYPFVGCWEWKLHSTCEEIHLHSLVKAPPPPAPPWLHTKDLGSIRWEENSRKIAVWFGILTTQLAERVLQIATGKFSEQLERKRCPHIRLLWNINLH